MKKQQQPKGIVRRRELLLLGLSGLSALVFGKSHVALAAEKKKTTERIIKEVDSIIPGYAKVRLSKTKFRAGARAKGTIKNPVICEISKGSLVETIDGKKIVRNEGDLWTSKAGQVFERVNQDKEIAVLRTINLIEK